MTLGTFLALCHHLLEPLSAGMVVIWGRNLLQGRRLQLPVVQFAKHPLGGFFYLVNI